jgi:hypothetical protein
MQVRVIETVCGITQGIEMVLVGLGGIDGQHGRDTCTLHVSPYQRRWVLR